MSRITDEMVERAEATLTFMGMPGTRLPGTEAVDVRRLLEAALMSETPGEANEPR